MDPTTDFISVYSHPDDDVQNTMDVFGRYIFRYGKIRINEIVIWYSNALLEYMGDFDFTGTKFGKEKRTDSLYKSEILDKIVYQYRQRKTFPSTRDYYPSRLTSVSVRSDLVEGGS